MAPKAPGVNTSGIPFRTNDQMLPYLMHDSHQSCGHWQTARLASEVLRIEILCWAWVSLCTPSPTKEVNAVGGTPRPATLRR